MSELIHVLPGTGDKKLDRLIHFAGYDYDREQNIFTSTLDPWQRNMGYCRLYDESAALLGMIIDREPVYFDYKGKKWMVGLWKGQYDLVTGAEIGIYTEAFNISLSHDLGGTFFKPVSNDEYLNLSFSLKKKGNPLFSRKGRHWWLTGFMLGEFSEPSELSMDISITLKDEEMRDAFVDGLTHIGYSREQIDVSECTVCFTFDTPYTPIQITRQPETDHLIQIKNKLLCEEYRKLTDQYPSLPEKFAVLKKEAPEIYEKTLGFGQNNKYHELLLISSLLAVIIMVHFLTKTKRN